MKYRKVLLILSISFNLIIAFFFIGKRIYYSNYTYFHPDQTSEQRWTEFLSKPKDSLEVVFVGTSMTYNFPIKTLFENKHIINMGFAGSKTDGILQVMKKVVSRQPKKIFLEGGINDIRYGIKTNSTISNISKMIDVVKANSPNTKIFLQSILPTNRSDYNKQVEELNMAYQKLARAKGATYIDLYPTFLFHGKIDDAATLDGIHLNSTGYVLWRRAIDSLINK